MLLPSSSRDSEDFDAIAEQFADAGYRVLRPQPRGMCGSTGPMTGLTLHDYARDVATVIERLGAAPAFVLGHAFGQWIGRCVAADHPHLVRGVILAAAAAKSANPALRERTGEMHRHHPARLGSPGRPANRLLRPRPRPLFLARQLASRGIEKPTRRQRRHPPKRVVVRRIGPVLDLQAEHDPWRPAETRAGILDDLGSQRVTVALIPNASHALIPEQPEAVVHAVSDWTRTVRQETP